jgi:hypothetical protein
VSPERNKPRIVRFVLSHIRLIPAVAQVVAKWIEVSAAVELR